MSTLREEITKVKFTQTDGFCIDNHFSLYGVLQRYLQYIVSDTLDKVKLREIIVDISYILQEFGEKTELFDVEKSPTSILFAKEQLLETYKILLKDVLDFFEQQKQSVQKISSERLQQKKELLIERIIESL
jgi:hypothetical protein